MSTASAPRHCCGSTTACALQPGRPIPPSTAPSSAAIPTETGATESRDEKGKWLAEAKDAGFLDVVLDCAAEDSADPATLVRAARDFRDTHPRFAVAVGLLAVRHSRAGGGFDAAMSEASEAVRHLLAAASRIEAEDWAWQELDRLAEAS